jgi:hypothetical protein
MADFTHYQDRRKFSDAVHSKMAVKVYKYLGWELDDGRDEDYRRKADLTDGIDYYLRIRGHHSTVQERFRTAANRTYNDITFRYDYPEHLVREKESEWFKITADYMLYGIIQKATREAGEITEADRFAKLVVLDLRLFSVLLDRGKIQIGTGRQSKFENGILTSGMNQNVAHTGDSPSRFVVFDVRQLYELNPEIIVLEKGFGTPAQLREDAGF